MLKIDWHKTGYKPPKPKPATKAEIDAWQLPEPSDKEVLAAERRGREKWAELQAAPLGKPTKEYELRQYEDQP